MRPEIYAQLIAVVGDNSPLLAPDATIVVRAGGVETEVPLAHLRAFILSLCAGLMKDTYDPARSQSPTDSAPDPSRRSTPG